jgi:hypothetical protein
MTLRQELEQQLQHASPDVLRQALQVLKKRSG